MKQNSNLDFSTGARITGLSAPGSAFEPATKAYTDALAAGLVPAPEVRAMSTGANITLATPGANLDGVALANGDRILLKDQTTASQNGPWIFNGAASALTRPTDFPSATAQKSGLTVFVAEGTVGVGSVMTLITEGGVTVDTTGETWSQTNGLADVTVGTGLTKTGNQVALTTPVAVANGGTGSGTAAGARGNLGATGKATSDIGNAALTTFPVAHGLGTGDITNVAVFDRGTGALEAADWKVVDANNVSVGPFATPPATVAGGAWPGCIGTGAGKHVVVTG